MTPLIEELPQDCTVHDAFVRFASDPGTVLFDSAITGALGRYSFLAIKPSRTWIVDQPENGTNPFEHIAAVMDQHRTEPVDGLPPFQGGATGLLSYDLGRCFERLPTPPVNEFNIPAAIMHLHEAVVAWDHHQKRCWIIGHGPVDANESARTRSAKELLAEFRNRMQSPLPSREVPLPSEVPSSTRVDIESPFATPLSGPAFDDLPGLRSNFSQSEYLQAVQRVIDFIYAGDIFQANLSQRLMFPSQLDPVTQYLRLREANPAPFAGYFAHDDWAVMSSSPERFLQLRSRTLSTRPIKGTRQRRLDPQADLYSGDELRESEKDTAENIMIVDLLRNDLSRVCKPGEIRVPELCTVESYETVLHLVSEVTGILRDGATFWDALAATFPGGSITGAPKIRAMEIITELEQVARGPYCGSLFYHSYTGDADSNILIRTMTQRYGWLQFPAGGGIVAQSEPQNEYEETLHKARGLLKSLSAG